MAPSSPVRNLRECLHGWLISDLSTNMAVRGEDVRDMGDPRQPTKHDMDEPLRTLMPLTVAVCERWGPAIDFGLTPDEATAVARATESRRREFATGRHCARSALLAFGKHGISIAANPDRTPAWPPGLIGSITHTQGYCGVAVASVSEFLGVGVDAERDDALHQALWPTICRSEELARLEALPPDYRVAMATLVFSAKESFYKCQYPVSRRWLDFHDVSVEVKGSIFIVSPRTDLGIDGFQNPLMGRFIRKRGVLLTAMVVPRKPTDLECPAD